MDIPLAQRAALEALAASLGISVDQISLMSIEAVDWPDHCLGVVRRGVMCAQGVVPGFRIILEAKGQQSEYRTNADGSVISPVTDLPVAPADAILAAREALAKALGVPAMDVTVASSTPIEWPDACLGVTQPGMTCAEVMTPGYLIVLEAQGKQYAYHTNQAGSVVRSGSVVLTWERQGGLAGFCDALSIFQSGEVEATDCRTNGANAPIVLSDTERAKLTEWLDKYGSVSVTRQDAPVAADGMTLTLNFNGTGSGQSDKTEQQAMLDWAQSVYTRLQA